MDYSNPRLAGRLAREISMANDGLVAMSERKASLSIVDHRRDSAGLKYVYPVVSRRAGGVSVGINLNTNNACNWACIYCQVPGLVRGGPEPIDLALLETELSEFLQDVLNGGFMQRHVPIEARRLVDIAFSGNGEPTLSRLFPQAVDVAIAVMRSLAVPTNVPLRLITNGSMVHRLGNQQALHRIGEVRGEIWFKIDRATAEGVVRVNQVWVDPETILRRLRLCAERAPTWIQTCWFGIDGKPPSPEESSSYLDLIAQIGDQVRGVLLYGIARQPMQPGAERLTRLPPEVLQDFGRQIEARGVEVRVSP